MNWIKTSEQLPTTVIGETVDVLFYSLNWACLHVGIYSNFGDKEYEKWALHDQVNDKYLIFFDKNDELPEYWMKIELPE